MERGQEPQRLISAEVQQALRIAELGSDLVMVLDADGAVLHVSDGLRALLGLGPRWRRRNWRSAIHPDDAEPLHAQRLRAATLPDDAIVQARYRLQDAQGRWHWLRERTAVLARDADGAATC
jgi:PAS domain S-box-containing protein